MNTATDYLTNATGRDGLTATLEAKMADPQRSPDFDLRIGTADVLAGVGLCVADSGGKLTFYGQDPILPSFPSLFARPRGMKRKSSGQVDKFAAYADGGAGNEVGFCLVPRARSLVGPEALRAPRIVATSACAPEHDY